MPLFSVYGIHTRLFSYMVTQPIVLGMALLWAAIDSSLSQGPLLWRHNEMTVIGSRNTRGRNTRQRLDNVNARWLQPIDYVQDSMRFAVHFCEITPYIYIYILRDVIVGYVQSLGYSINALAIGSRTPYRVGSLAGDVMRAWVSHYLVNHLIYTFKASLLI